MTTSNHRWKIYRSGGVDQVAIQTGDDLLHLHELDPKLSHEIQLLLRAMADHNAT